MEFIIHLSQICVCFQGGTRSILVHPQNQAQFVESIQSTRFLLRVNDRWWCLRNCTLGKINYCDLKYSTIATNQFFFFFSFFYQGKDNQQKWHINVYQEYVGEKNNMLNTNSENSPCSFNVHYACHSQNVYNREVPPRGTPPTGMKVMDFPAKKKPCALLRFALTVA